MLVKVSNEEREILYKEYMVRYKYLCDLSSQTTKMYHNALMTINAGAFGLSFTYLLQMKEYISKSPIMFIVFSWICMAISLITTLVTQINGLQLLDDDIELSSLKFDYSVGYITSEDDKKREKLEKKNPKKAKFNNFCEVAQGVITTAGIILLIVYTCITILNSKMLGKPINNSVTKETTITQKATIQNSANSINIKKDENVKTISVSKSVDALNKSKSTKGD
jgi:hypothetical protein